MRKHVLGTMTLAVSEVGFGCMGLTTAYGTPADEHEAIALLHQAIDQG